MSAPSAVGPYTVSLDQVFHGPMDLLLHLVREQEVEIHEIEISRVIEGYLQHLSAMKDLDLEIAGDFVVMAATLMAIKSRSLLPREEVDLEKELDPRDELIQRLIEYRRFKDASDRLGERWELRALSFARGSAGLEGEDRDEPVLDLGDLTCWDLLAHYSRLMRETMASRPHRVAPDARPLRYWVGEVARRVREAHEISLRALLSSLEPAPGREALVGSFCAILELVKLGLISVVQPDHGSDIAIRLNPEHEGDIESVVQTSIFADEIEEEPELAAAAPPAVEGSPAAGGSPEGTPEADRAHGGKTSESSDEV